MPKDEYKNLKILYVEDEEFIRINAVSYLRRLFNYVYEASNAHDAISIIEEQNPHIVITDIKMPNISGLDMIRQLREYDKKTKFIVLSAFTDTKYLLDAIDLGLVKYLTKPIRHDIFSDKESKIYISETCFFDSINNNLINEEKTISTTKTELLFLKLLIKKSPSAVTYEELQNNIWYDEYMSENAIRLLVRDFRKKLPSKAIKNISKIGYKIDLL